MITEVFFTLYIAGVIYRYVELAANDNDIDVVDLLYPWEWQCFPSCQKSTGYYS